MLEEDLDDDFDLGIPEDDLLDAENFNAVDYINKQFPNEASLKGLDSFVEGMRAQQTRIDDDIRHAVRRQAACGRRARSDLDEAKAAVRELFERIKMIKTKAEQSEALVSDVCRDIKSLDIAKRNLTQTVTGLKRLVMLVTALEQLRTLSSNRQYQEASRLIHAIEELTGHFRGLSHVARVADLLERKAAIFSDLRAQLLEDFASLHGPAHARLSGVEHAACCVDAMDASVRREVITQFCLRVLEDYKDIFQPPKEASGLETAERRYAWLNRTLNGYDDKYASHFPEAWRVACGLCEHFCHVTRQHLVEVLSTSHHTVDPELMVRILRKSIDFENNLAMKYPVEDVAPASPEGTTSAQLPDYASGAASFGFKYPDVLGNKAPNHPAAAGGGVEAAQFAPRFRGIISECFDAYLSSWVQHEEKQLLDALDRSTASGVDKIVGQDERDEDDEEGDMEPRYLYTSAPDLFASMKTSMTRCAGFSTHQTLFDVFQVFRKVIAQYADKLSNQLPAKVSASLDNNAVQAVCCVIGTADYCDATMPQLVDSLLRVIDPAYEDRVSAQNEQDILSKVMGKAIQVLVQSVNSGLDEAFGKMTRTGWAQFSQDVGDHSPYAGEISERLPQQLAPIARHLSKMHYRFFCDKFVNSFVTRFIAEIYRCRKISEQGAQQLLLDTSLIKTTLLEAPVVAGRGQQMTTVYSNYVVREMGRAETMLKVLSSPDVDAAAVSALLGDDRSSPESAAEIERLLSLRASSGGTVDLPNPPGDEERFDNSSMAALRSNFASLGDTFNQKSVKTSDDLKKLSGDVKKKLLSGIMGGRKDKT